MRKIRIAITLIVALSISCTTENETVKDTVDYINSFIGSTGPTDSDYGGTIPSVAPPLR